MMRDSMQIGQLTEVFRAITIRLLPCDASVLGRQDRCAVADEPANPGRVEGGSSNTSQRLLRSIDHDCLIRDDRRVTLASTADHSFRHANEIRAEPLFRGFIGVDGSPCQPAVLTLKDTL